MTAAGLIGRVGGLAVAVGAGALIGLALAAPASADTTRGAATTEHSSPSPRRAGASSVRAERPVSARPFRVTAAKAEASRNTRPTPAPEPVLAAAAQQPRRTDNPAVAPAAAVGAAQSTPARSRPDWGDPRGRLITIYKGTHFAIPNSFGYFIKRVSGTGTFTANTVYDLKDVDQYDWNKFTGIAFTPLQPDRNSVMVGWRYNLKTQEFEIAPFYNVDKKRILPNELTEVISVPVDQTFDYLVDYTGVTISYGGRTVFKPYPEGLTPNVWTAARVSGWFGGNEVAPRTVSYYLKLNR